MDDSEREHITRNLTILLRDIRCNRALSSYLVQGRIISKNEEQEMFSKTTDSDKNMYLLDILMTRKSGYDNLLQALRVESQGGVVDVLERLPRLQASTGPKPRKLSHEETSATLQIDKKWERVLEDKKEIFNGHLISPGTALEQIKQFYEQEMSIYFEENRFVSSSVLSDINKKLCASIKKGIFGIVTNEHVISKVEDVLNDAFQNVHLKCASSLASGLHINDTPAIGIDLGTCNCCVAVWWNCEVKLIYNSDMEKTTPSFVAFEEGEPATVGKVARKEAFRNSLYTMYDTKRLIGRNFSDKMIQKDLKHWQFQVVKDRGGADKPMLVTPEGAVSPEFVSSILLKQCVQYAETDLQKKITKAVITVPAYFNDRQINATIQAGEMAGITILQILKEPTAAAIMYKQERKYHVAKRVLIFDMGGGTFDVAVADIKNDGIVIVGIDGDTHLGGEDFDIKIMEYCIDEFKRTTGNDLRKWKTVANDRRNLSALKFECEEAKKNLSTKHRVKISIAQDEDSTVTLTRDKFEELVSYLLDKMISIVDRLLRTTNVSKDEIEDIILVGGSTRFPRLQEMLSNYFHGKQLNHNANHDHAVAYGAAIMAAVLNGEALNVRNISDVIPMSIGIQCIKQNITGRFKKIIMKNSKYPSSQTKTFTTSSDNQDGARIKIYQGEHDMVEENFFIGEFFFKGILKAPKGNQVIEVVMKINQMGVLEVMASSGNAIGTKTFAHFRKGIC